MRWLCWWQPPCVLHRVLVTFTHDATAAFEGVLWRYRGGWLTLKDVSAITAGQAPAKLPGDVVIHRSQVAYLQVAP